MRYIYFVFFTLLLVLGWIFGVQNSAILAYPITLKTQLWLVGFESIPLPLGAALILAFVMGVGFTLLGLLNRELRLRRELRTRNLENRHLQTELNNLRQQVLQSDEEKYTAEPAPPPRQSLTAQS